MMNQSLLLGSPTIDHQHQGLFALLERLSGLPRNTNHEEEVSDILGKLTKQLQHHFLTEETVMDRLAMPNAMLKAHRAAHHKIIEELTQLHMDSMAGRPHSLDTIITDVSRWVYQHVLEYDLEMKPYINGD
jgi:hemerythrin